MEPSTGLTAQDRQAEDEIRRLNEVERKAFLDRDLKTLAQIWSDEFIVNNPLNKLVTKKQVLEMMESGFLAQTSLEKQIEYLRVSGNTVIVAGCETVTWGKRMPRAGQSDQLRFTSIWMKEGEEWKEVARHAHVVAR
jgi:ketosteroid isomerase-like protein